MGSLLGHHFQVNPQGGGGGITEVSVINVGECGTPHPDVFTVQGCIGMEPISVIVTGLEISTVEVSGVSITNVGPCGNPSPDVITVQGCSGMEPVVISGDIASGDPDSGNPIKVGAQARQTNPTPVSNGDRTDLITDDIGRLVVVNSHVRDQVFKQRTSVSGTTETTIVTAGGAGVFRDLTFLAVSCNTNNVDITVRESTGGTIVWVGRLDDDQQFVLNFSPPLPQTTANSAWTIQANSAGADLEVLAQAVNNV